MPFIHCNNDDSGANIGSASAAALGLSTEYRAVTDELTPWHQAWTVRPSGGEAVAVHGAAAAAVVVALYKSTFHWRSALWERAIDILLPRTTVSHKP